MYHKEGLFVEFTDSKIAKDEGVKIKPNNSAYFKTDD